MSNLSRVMVSQPLRVRDCKKKKRLVVAMVTILLVLRLRKNFDAQLYDRNIQRGLTCTCTHRQLFGTSTKWGASF